MYMPINNLEEYWELTILDGEKGRILFQGMTKIIFSYFSNKMNGRMHVQKLKHHIFKNRGSLYGFSQ